ncbi:MAG: hypothetical protein M3P51_14115 [Chloroflexota bacterium]|nr:hypothetical protein [Chloroflexota bacterium]
MPPEHTGIKTVDDLDSALQEALDEIGAAFGDWAHQVAPAFRHLGRTTGQVLLLEYAQQLADDYGCDLRDASKPSEES